jgi:hypothetical protein
MRITFLIVIGLTIALSLAGCGSDSPASTPVEQTDVQVDAYDSGPDLNTTADLAPQDLGNPEKDTGPCFPSCGTKICGDDGCGGSCGPCGEGEVCLMAGSCAPTPNQPSPGALIITEIMADPFKAADADGEWFEIRNVTAAPIGLQHLVIRDLGDEHLEIPGMLILAPGGFFVVGQKGNPEDNGGATVHYEWDGFSLTNAEDQIILEFKGGEVDRVEWFEPMWYMPIGASLSLPPDKQNAADNNVFGHWCVAQESMNGPGTDLGTPGSGNPACGGCAPNCAGVACGPDGCGGFCGQCGDGLTCQGGKCVESTGDGPDVGEVIINEIMPDPDAVADNNGEWIELVNTTSKTLKLMGMVVRDEGSDKFTIDADISISGYGFIVLARNGETPNNGGVTADFVYGSNMNLANKDDEIVLEYNGVLIDSVTYNAEQGWPVTSGAALSLHPITANWEINDKPEAWCSATTPMAAGDLGTPGFINPACGQ